MQPIEMMSADEAHERGVPAGWWGADPRGQLILGPYPSREAALIGIAAHGFSDGTGVADEAPEPAALP